MILENSSVILSKLIFLIIFALSYIANKVSFSITEPSELSKTLTIKKVASESTDNI